MNSEFKFGNAPIKLDVQDIIIKTYNNDGSVKSKYKMIPNYSSLDSPYKLFTDMFLLMKLFNTIYMASKNYSPTHVDIEKYLNEHDLWRYFEKI